MRRILFILTFLLAYSYAAFAQQPLPSPLFKLSNNQICITDSIKVTYTGYSKSVYAGGLDTFKWNFGGAFKIDSAGPGGPYELHFNAGVPSGNISLIVDSAGLASSKFSVAITVNDTPTGNISVTDTGCFKSDVSIAFNGSTGGTGTYFWNYAPGTYVNGNNSGSGPILVRYDSANSVPNQHYPITLKVRDQNGCIAHFSNSFFLADVPHHIVFYGTPLQGCAPLTVTFTDTVTGANTYSWAFGDGTSTNLAEPIHIYQSGGKYTVTLRAYGTHGCVDSSIRTNYATVFPPPSINFYTDPLDNVPVELSNATFNFYNETGGAVKYKWFFGDSIVTKADSSHAKDTVHTYTKTGTYIVWLYASDSFGCIDSAYHTIVVIPNSQVFIPNTFTPNGDGRNDVWFVYGHDIERVQMRIYDRWGEEVYSSDDFFAGWDGSFHGKPANTGVYSYVATVYRSNERVEHYRGGVTLVR